MMNYLNNDDLIFKATWETLSANELDYIVQEIKESKPGDDDNLSLFICALGRAGAKEYRQLVEKYLHYPSFPWVAAESLQTLCRRWGFATDYLPFVKMFIRGMEWDISDEVRMRAISIAGEYLAYTFERELLQLLVDLYENQGEFHTLYPTSPEAREFLQSCAYTAIARAMGKDWDAIPDVDKIQSFISNKQSRQLDLTVLQQAHQKLKSSK